MTQDEVMVQEYVAGQPDEVVYIRLGYRQFWRRPYGWEETDYRDVLDTIRRHTDIMGIARRSRS